VIKVLFFGTPTFSVPTLEALYAAPGIQVAAVITQPDKPVGRGGVITPPPIKTCAEFHRTPVFQPTSIRKEFASLKEQLNPLGPFDLGVVIAFGQILPEEVLNFPKAGCVNIHASILPRWRGAAPIQRAIEAGDRETGVCLMQMDIGLDTGAVFSEQRIPITDRDTSSSMHDVLAQAGANLLTRDISQIVSGALPPTPQSDVGVTYAKKILNDEAKIDWTKDSNEIVRKIRAFCPFPGCFTSLNGKRLKILNAHPVEIEQSISEDPGAIIQALSDTLTVKCGDGAIRVMELQLEGKKKMTTSEFLRGSNLGVGTVLGLN
jgi:methionyl-tRNA formyltransferase